LMLATAFAENKINIFKTVGYDYFASWQAS
jgi:hypothetical protein